MEFRKELERKLLFENLVDQMDSCPVIGDYPAFTRFKNNLMIFPVFGIQEIQSDIKQQKDTVTISYVLKNRKEKYKIKFTYYKDELREIDYTFLEKVERNWCYTTIVYRFLNNDVVKVIEKKSKEDCSDLEHLELDTEKQDYYLNGRFICSEEYVYDTWGRFLTHRKYMENNSKVYQKILYSGKGEITDLTWSSKREVSAFDLQKIYQFDKRFHDVYKMVRRKGKY